MTIQCYSREGVGTRMMDVSQYQPTGGG